MSDVERYWVVGTGIVGLIAFAGGSVLSAVPPVDRQIDEVMAVLQRRRAQVLAGSVLSVTGAALLLWPVAAIATTSSDGVWASMALFSLAVAVLGFAFMTFSAIAIAALAWRGPDENTRPVAQVLLDASHLAVWSVSAPIGAIFVSATTAVGVQADLLGPIVVAVAVIKVATVAVEVAGTGRRTGWNVGGWAAGSSGYATVAWFTVVVFSLL